MISVAALADSCIPWANLFCEYFPAIDLLLKCHIIELFEWYQQHCESRLCCLIHIASELFYCDDLMAAVFLVR